MSHFAEKTLKISRQVLCGCFLIVVLAGCATVPLTTLLPSDGSPEILQELMARNNKIVRLTPGPNRNKPALLLLHGATEDPGEMIDIIRQFKVTHDVFLYSYNFHLRAEKVAAALADEMKLLKSRKAISTNLTVVTFSYSAIIFRAAVVLTEDRTVFADASLIQLVPTSGGSFLARGMGIASGLVALASKPSAASYPFGKFAKELWEGEGNRKFFEVIEPERMWSILLEGDSHSLAKIRDKEVRKRYQNGIGTNVTMISKATGVTHDYFPNHPVVIAHLKEILTSGNYAAFQSRIAPQEAALRFEKSPEAVERLP